MKPADAPLRVLSFDDNPPYTLPMRFLLSAPLFALLAATLLFWQGGAAFGSRWSAPALAMTHLMVLGCLAMAMIGALLQLLPVVAGARVPRVRPVAILVHAGLCAGTLLLAAAFLLQLRWLFWLAALPLAAALLLFLSACTVGLWQQHVPGVAAVVSGIRLSLASLVPTMVLGGLLASAFAWPADVLLPLQRLTDLHAMWGLLGWVGLLVMAIAFQVVPMFMLTEPYPRFLTQGFTSALFLLLAAAALSSGLGGPAEQFHAACLALLTAGYALFAAVTLRLLARRRRPRADATTLYWRTAMASLLGALALGWWQRIAPSNAGPLAAGVLLIAGFALSAVNGMLYKIVPFLSWYHLQEAAASSGRKLPGVNHMISDRLGQWQFILHAAALLFLLGACYAPAMLARPAAALMGAACLGLLFNLGAPVLLYWQLRPARAAAIHKA